MPTSFDPEHPVIDLEQPLYVMIRDYVQAMVQAVFDKSLEMHNYLNAMSNAHAYAAHLNEVFGGALRQAFCEESDKCRIAAKCDNGVMYLALTIRCCDSNPLNEFIQLPREDITILLGWLQPRTVDTAYYGISCTEVFADFIDNKKVSCATVPLQYLPWCIYKLQIGRVWQAVDQTGNIHDYLEKLPDEHGERLRKLRECFSHLFASPEKLSPGELTVHEVLHPIWQNGLMNAVNVIDHNDAVIRANYLRPQAGRR